MRLFPDVKPLNPVLATEINYAKDREDPGATRMDGIITSHHLGMLGCWIRHILSQEHMPSL